MEKTRSGSVIPHEQQETRERKESRGGGAFPCTAQSLLTLELCVASSLDSISQQAQRSWREQKTCPHEFPSSTLPRTWTVEDWRNYSKKYIGAVLKRNVRKDLLPAHGNLVGRAERIFTEKERMSYSEKRKKQMGRGGQPHCSSLDHGYSWVDNTDVDVIA